MKVSDDNAIAPIMTNGYTDISLEFKILSNIEIKKKFIQTKAVAFIITNNCTSERFQFTKHNIEQAFPNFFHIHCFKSIPLNDSRIHTSSSLVLKKLSSNLLSFMTVWTYEIPAHSQYGDEEWSFVFEDGVDFINPLKFSLSNYIDVLKEMMNNPEIHFQHGLFYLGICAPNFTKNSQPLITKYSNNSLLSYKGYGWCAHAMGLTTKRARYFWTEISSYRPTLDTAIDIFLRNFCIRSGNRYYILGANLHWPPQTGHYGIAFQDRMRYYSGMI